MQGLDEQLTDAADLLGQDRAGLFVGRLSGQLRRLASRTAWRVADGVVPAQVAPVLFRREGIGPAGEDSSL